MASSSIPALLQRDGTHMPDPLAATAGLYYIAYAPHDFTAYGEHFKDGQNVVDAYPRTDTGNYECVAFVQGVAGLPNSRFWRPGRSVKGNMSIPAGAAIATFTGSGYKGHAAIYLGQDEAGIFVADQWKTVGHAARRRIPFLHKVGEQRYISNNGDAFRVIDPAATAAAAGQEANRTRVVSIGP